MLIQHDDSTIVSGKSLIKVVLKNLCVGKKMVMEEEGQERKKEMFQYEEKGNIKMLR